MEPKYVHVPVQHLFNHPAPAGIHILIVRPPVGEEPAKAWRVFPPVLATRSQQIHKGRRFMARHWTTGTPIYLRAHDKLTLVDRS